MDRRGHASTSRRHFSTRCLALSLASSAAWSGLAAAPARGSARLLAQRLSGDYAETVIVENRPGASGQLAVVALKGSVPGGAGRTGLSDVAGGRLTAFVTVLGSLLPHVQAGHVRLLAVTGSARDPFAPDVPTLRELGIPIQFSEWYGVFAPPSTPAVTVQRAAAAVAAAAGSPVFVRELASMAMTAGSSTPQAMVERLQSEREQWREGIRRIGFRSGN